MDAFRLLQWPMNALEPRFSLFDTDHRRRSEEDFRGLVCVVFFGFTQCPDICPTEMFKLALVVKRLGTLASQVRVLFISLDPERDTAALLKTYVAAFDPDFIGLTGSAADINRAAESFSVQFAKVPQGNSYTIAHSSGAYVLDKTGRLRLVGTTKSSVEDWLNDLRLLAAEASGAGPH
jgi:protein SCO1/2